MKTGHQIALWLALLALTGLELQGTSSFAQGTTAFTYEGKLSSATNAVTGSHDFIFSLYDAQAGGNQVGNALTNTAIDVVDGLFTVTLDFGSVFDGSGRWLEISLRTNGGGPFTLLSPRQMVMPTPYALFTATAATASNVVVGAVSAPQFATPGSPTLGQVLAFDGSSLIWTNAGAAAAAWLLGGNAGTTPANQWLGTADNQPLVLEVNGQQAVWLQSALNGAPNIIGGWNTNVSADVGSQTISGGSSNSIQLSLWQGETIGGGQHSSIGPDDGAVQSAGGWITIGGGCSNLIGRQSSGATTAGGKQNWQVFSTAGFIGGGSGNLIDTVSYGAISGGYSNRVGDSGRALYLPYGATVAGGEFNYNIQNYGVVGGGQGNRVDVPQRFSSQTAGTIGGGVNNILTATLATIPGGGQANASHYGQLAYASGQFASSGDAQTSTYVCRGITTNATPTQLFLDGNSARIVIPTNSTWGFDALVTGRDVSGNSAAFHITGGIKNANGTTVLVGWPATTPFEDVSCWNAMVVADTANNALAVQVTGTASTSIRWVASVRTVEVTY